MRRRPRHSASLVSQRRRARQDAASAAVDIKCIVLRLVVVGRNGWGGGGIPGDGEEAGERGVGPDGRRPFGRIIAALIALLRAISEPAFLAELKRFALLRSGYMAQTREKRNCYGEAT